MAVIPDDFTIEGGGRLDPTWFDPYDLIELLGTWIARASTTGASDALVTARVYAAAFTTAADLLMADPANQRDREKSSAYLAEQLKYWRDQAAAYEDEAAGLIGLNGAVLVQWEGDPPCGC